MKSLFIIPCAIMIGDDQNVHFERYFQLMHTVESISSRFIDFEIKILELSGKPVYPSMIEILQQRAIIISFEGDIDIIKIREDAKTVDLPVSKSARPSYELGYIKNATESKIIYRTLSQLSKNDYDRVYKITGRYFFSDWFFKNNHIVKGKITLKKRNKCAHGKKLTGTDYLRHCMYWGFCTSILDEVTQVFLDIHNYIVDMPNQRKIGTIENGLDLFVRENIINTVETTGVFWLLDCKYPHMD